jgi:hypothetical protein
VSEEIEVGFAVILVFELVDKDVDEIEELHGLQ